MKFKKCPARKHCFDYKDNNCDNCDIGNEITKLHKRIDRLKKQNETLTIQRNAWALTAKNLGEKWISVEERLPEVRERVLIYSYHDGVNTGYRADDIGRFYVDKSYPYRPTHWMPLPEPPKMKGGAG
jgi:hypothetical protein